MSKIRINIIANYGGRIWSFVSIYTFIPLYLKVLGVENYAVIGFYSVLLSLMAFADIGLTATLNREFAEKGYRDSEYASKLLKTFELLYYFIVFLIVLIIYFSAPTIVDNFLNSENISSTRLILFVRIMGGIIGLQFFSTLYSSGLMGLQEQVTSNLLSVSYGLLRSGLVIIPLLFYPSLETYFYWQLLSVFIYLLVIRFFLWKKIRVPFVKIDLSILKNLWKYALGMMYMSVIGALNIQIDKMMVSNLLSLKEFGYYSLATTFAQIPVILAGPIMLAVFPELTKHIGLKDNYEVTSIFVKYSFIIAAVISGVVVVLSFYSNDLLYIWTQDLVISEKISVISKILLIGSLFLSLQYTSYYLALANSYTKANVVLGSLCVVFIISVISFFINNFGLLGATFPWLIYNFLIFLILSKIIIKKFLDISYLKWLFKYNVYPISISCIIGFLFYSIFSILPQGRYVILYSAVIFLIIFSLNAVLYNYIFKTNIFKFLKKQSND